MILAGLDEPTPGLDVVTYATDGQLALGPDDQGQRQTRWIRGICLHVTDGQQVPVRPGSGPSGRARNVVGWWRNPHAGHAGTHLIVDSDGRIFQLADLVTAATWHATTVNHVTVGVDLYQPRNPSGLYVAQLDAFVKLLDWLTGRLGIQRQFQRVYHGHPCMRISSGGANVVGIYGHRDQTTGRGVDDPGDAPFTWLQQAGYEPVDFALDEDLQRWRARQVTLNKAGAQLVVDGVAGPATRAALVRAGYPQGQWVRRG